MLLMGDDGALQLDLGDGLVCSAEVTSYRLLIARNRLRTTQQGDEWETSAGGLRQWSGELSFNIRIGIDPGYFTAAQIIPAIMAGEGEAEVPAVFYLQSRSGMGGDCDGPVVSSQPAYFQGLVILDEVTIEVTDPTALMRGAARFTGTGEPVFVR